MTTTYRALCAELVAAFNSYHLFTDAETTTASQRAERVNQAIAAADAALKAEPEGEGPSVEQMYYWALKSIYKYGSDTLSELADDREWLRAAVAEMVRRAQESLDYGTPVAQPAPEVSNKQIEAAAKLIYASMRSAATDSHGACDWVERGNSLMQDEARRTARAVLNSQDRPATPTTPPAPESEEMQGLVIDLREVSLILDTMKAPRLATTLDRAATLLKQQHAELSTLRFVPTTAEQEPWKKPGWCHPVTGKCWIERIAHAGAGASISWDFQLPPTLQDIELRSGLYKYGRSRSIPSSLA